MIPAIVNRVRGMRRTELRQQQQSTERRDWMLRIRMDIRRERRRFLLTSVMDSWRRMGMSKWMWDTWTGMIAVDTGSQCLH
jgi:hypothetical protein